MSPSGRPGRHMSTSRCNGTALLQSRPSRQVRRAANDCESPAARKVALKKVHNSTAFVFIAFPFEDLLVSSG